MLHLVRRTRSAVLCAFVLASASAALLAGCNGALTPTPAANALVLTGNWQFSSTAATASRLPALSGELTGTSSRLTGILHPMTGGGCAATTSAIDVTGTTNASTNVTTLTGALAGGTLTITGTPSADGKSLTGATYTVTGGSCALAPAAVTAQAFTPINGTYVGNLTDGSGATFQVTAVLAQSPSSDTTGNFTLTGTASFPAATGCIASPTPLTSATVTGGTFTTTYTDTASQNAVSTSGTFSTDGTTLTIGNWSLSAGCGGATGTGGVLTRQS